MKQAERRKFHYIYKITRTAGSGKYYIGMHSTDDLDDGYFGSGQLLWKSIKKHGKEKHSKEILEFLPTRTELKKRERELVNEEIINDPRCMNLVLGGDGGFSEYARRLGSPLGGKATLAKRTPAIRSEISRKAAITKMAKGTLAPFNGKIHRESSKLAIGEANAKAQLGSKNSQYGTVWVIKEGKPAKIHISLLQKFLNDGYRRGRK